METVRPGDNTPAATTPGPCAASKVSFSVMTSAQVEVLQSDERHVQLSGLLSEGCSMFVWKLTLLLACRWSPRGFNMVPFLDKRQAHP